MADMSAERIPARKFKSHVITSEQEFGISRTEASA